MSFNLGEADRYVDGDRQCKDSPSSAEVDKHRDLIDERGDRGTSIKPDVRDVTKELIAKESKHNVAPNPELMTQSSCTLSTIISMEDSHDDDGKRKSAESSDNELVVIDVGENGGFT